MKVALGCDHGGYELMQAVKEMLEEEHIEYLDCGCHGERTDYPDKAKAACDKVLSGEADFAVLICGTGIGMSIAANKMHGIRCALLSDCYSAEFTRLHNDTNCMAMGGRIIGPELAKRIARIFLTTKFSGEERHIKRIKMFEPDYDD